MSDATTALPAPELDDAILSPPEAAPPAAAAEPSATSTTTAPATESVANDLPVESRLDLRRGDQWFLAIAAAIACALMLWHWGRLSGWGLRPVEIDRLPQRQYDYRIDINRAGWVEWVQLPGIGETLARRIIDDRRRNGPFRRLDDLCRVRGIGPKTLDALRLWLTVGEE